MQNHLFIRIVGSTLWVAALPLLAASSGNSGKYGTDVFHYSIREAFVAEDSGSSAAGGASLTHKQQGGSSIQTLDISVQRLDANASYHLLAWLDHATNYTYVLAFDTDSDGRARLRYRGQGQGKAQGQGRKQLPGVIDPTSNIQELVIADVSTQAVLRADLGSADKLQYLLKKNLSSSQADAILRVKATERKGSLRLDVKDLAGPSPFALALNGNVTETLTPDAKGRVVLNENLDNPLGVLDLESVSMWDAKSNVIFQVTLP